MRVLIIGGTRFFGLRLARELLAHGHNLTVLTRGLADDDLGPQVERIRVDRRDHTALRDALSSQTYDLVYDQICYTPQDAKGALQALGDRVGRYVFTSSASVYRLQAGVIAEGDFEPRDYPYDLSRPDLDYGEGKRQAEAYLFRHAPCPVVAARVSMVISGTDDYTGRFDFHVRRVARGEVIGVDAQEQEITFVTAWDTAGFLRFLGTSEFQGPINFGNGWLSAQELCREIGRTLAKEPRFAVLSQDDEAHSPYVMGGLLRVTTDLARSIGYSFAELRPQLPEMTLAAAARLHL